MSQLDILDHHRDALLLAEAIGWLHDYRKCSDEQLRAQAANKTPQDQGLPKNQLFQLRPDLRIPSLSIASVTETMENILKNSEKKWNDSSVSFLLQYLSRCHNTAHFDKQDPVAGKQNYPGIQISSSFGFERSVLGNLTRQLWTRVPWDELTAYSQDNRQNLLKQVPDLFSQVGADTRRPINEVDLWGWGLLVGALYKTALAGILLSGGTPPAAHDLRWRLLSFRIDGLSYLLNVVRLPDLFSRQQLLHNGLNRVRCLLEETYPLSNEVYRDENGSLYVVADLPDLLNLTDSHGSTLRQLMLQEFAKGTLKDNLSLQLGGELTPVLELEATPWWGQDPDRRGNDELPAICAILSTTIRYQPDVADIQASWSSWVADICTVCQLRPQGPSQKAIERNVCDICEQRRLDRSQEWVTKQLPETIWIDEAADTNARLALIVGQFDLANWLDGTLLDSLLVIEPQNTEGKPVTSKTASFSRLRRVWETTRKFWQDIRTELAQSLSDDRRRLLLYIDREPDLGPFHVYDLDLGAVTLSVVWYPGQADGTGGYLISADNLNTIARQLKAEQDVYADSASAAIWLEDYLKQQFVQGTRPVVLRNPDAAVNERNRNLLTGHRIVKTQHQATAYSTAIPILAEPRTFMALVPADRSLDVLHAIKTKYEREMGKVRNRLPIHLGAVYFQRRTPLRAALDAGQAMLQRQSDADTPWQVQDVQSGALPAQQSKLADGTQQFQQTITITLERNGQTITWHVPAVMGDGNTTDNWYPYVFFHKDKDGNAAPSDRQRAFQGKRPTANGPQPCLLIHAGELQPGDHVYFSPSTFDFEFLDSTARRFEIHYNANGRRVTRRTRPFYLEDLERLDELWKYLKRLSLAQRHQVVATIEATREMWFGQDNSGQSHSDDVFRQFVADTLAGAEWPSGSAWKSIDQPWREKLIQAGISGELAGLFELRMEILKER